MADGATAFDESTGSSVVTVVNLDRDIKTVDDNDDTIDQSTSSMATTTAPNSIFEDIGHHEHPHHHDHHHNQQIAPNTMNSHSSYHTSTQHLQLQSDYSIDNESGTMIKFKSKKSNAIQNSKKKNINRQSTRINENNIFFLRFVNSSKTYYIYLYNHITYLLVRIFELYLYQSWRPF